MDEDGRGGDLVGMAKGEAVRMHDEGRDGDDNGEDVCRRKRSRDDGDGV